MTHPEKGMAKDQDVHTADALDHPDEPEVKKLDGRALLEQMGGFSGLIYSSLPVVVFVPVSTLFGLVPAISAALGVAVLVLVWRLIRRESLQPAISGFFAVGISALIAWWVGESRGFFAYGIWSSLVYAAVFVTSVLIRRPLVGYAWGSLSGHGHDWRSVRRAVLVFDVATCAWALVFAARFVVQYHLYDADEVGWLGVARISMGWPLTAVAALVTFLAIRAAQRAIHARDAALTDEPTEARTD
nr:MULTISPECIES: DUF3159 domain-containing protein [unclassified Mycobacterium]